MCYSLVVTLHQGKRKVCVQVDCDIDISSEAIQPCKTQVAKVVQAVWLPICMIFGPSLNVVFITLQQEAAVSKDYFILKLDI